MRTLLFSLGCIITSIAQGQTLYSVEKPVELYTVYSNVVLDSNDLSLVYKIDSLLTFEDLFIEQCLVLKESYHDRLMITLILTNGIDRTYFIERNPVKITLYNQTGDVIYDPE